MFIVTSKLLNRLVVYKCCLPNATITTVPKGSMNASVFIKWLLHFEQNIPGCVKIPIVILYGGYGS